MTGLWKIFKERDATLVEVNPLIETNQGEGILPFSEKLTPKSTA